MIAFIMPSMIFFALPEITRRNQHIAITSVMEMLKKETAEKWARLLAFVSAGVTAMAGYIILTVVIKQYSLNVLTSTIIQMPKWILLLPVVFNFYVVAIIFLITALTGRDE